MDKLSEIMEDARFFARIKTLNGIDYEIYKAKIAKLGLPQEKFEAVLRELLEVMGL